MMMTSLANDDPNLNPDDTTGVVGGLPQVKDEDHLHHYPNQQASQQVNTQQPQHQSQTAQASGQHVQHHQQPQQPQPQHHQYDPHHTQLYHSTTPQQQHSIHDPQLTRQQQMQLPQHQLHQQHHLSHNPVAAAAAAAAAAAQQQQQQQQLQHHLVQYGAPDHHHDQQDHLNVQLTQQLPSFPTSLTPQHHSHFQQQQQHQQQLQRQLQQQQQQLHQQQQQQLHHQHQQLQQQHLSHHQVGIPQQSQVLHQQQVQVPQQQHHHHHLDMLAGTGAGVSQSHEQEYSEPPANRKVAPRSTDLFRVGPQFSETRHHQEIYCKGNDMVVNPILEARIDRGFEIGENGNWIGYKRNYFTLVSAFTLENFNFERFINNKFYTFDKARGNGANGSVNGNGNGNGHLHHPHHPQLHHSQLGSKVDISYFAIRLVAKCSDDDVSISLIQHTAKRDKGPQFPPPIYPAVPGDLPDHETVRASCNKRNGNKIESMNKIFYFDRNDYYHHVNLNSNKDDSILKNYPSDSIARIARFERIQFTSSIRIKSASTNSRYFTLHVELLGIIEDEDLQIQPILLSSIETPPLIIRGRSPSNYHKDRTSGYRGHIQT
ncbi:uncharacterized protein RJT21DRAFT_122592 [Scheffersomyces amazonensis]|uniref:uncharacterized protein n=1 Tax=Scheffersomyces amazonensis TaxID=1078765 RepID=UPI00315C83EC